MSNYPKITEDLHIHTPLCNHAVGKMEEYVQVAIEKGITRFAFLEHLEYGIEWYDILWLSPASFDSYFRIGEQLQEKYADKIEILLGVECGWNPDAKEELQHVLTSRVWQEIGISCHYIKVPGRDLHLNLFSKNPKDKADTISIGVEKIFSMYLDHLIDAVTFLDGDKLCHLDGALRHVNLNYTPEHYDKIEKLLALLAQKKMALEVNTSGMRFRGEQFPATSILQMAKKYQLQITPASDSHRPEDVASGFEELGKLLENL